MTQEARSPTILVAPPPRGPLLLADRAQPVARQACSCRAVHFAMSWIGASCPLQAQIPARLHRHAALPVPGSPGCHKPRFQRTADFVLKHLDLLLEPRQGQAT